MAARRHPALEALMPEQERATVGIHHEGRSGEMSFHEAWSILKVRFPSPLTLPPNPTPYPMTLINSNSSALAIGDLLPHFRLPAVDGLTVDTRGIKDPFLVVIFTCNHCPYAQAYEDRILTMAEHFDQEGVQFILVNSNDPTDYPQDSFEAMKERYQEKGYPCPYCFDETQEVARSFGALCTPHCFVFGRDRTLQYKGRVDDNWEHPDQVKHRDLWNAIDALVENREPPVPEANAIGCSIKWKN
ncbi:MAG TPA: thioredoxin family protein [Candidatus Peribacter riflensis]|nr:thioredoxin family protein [Candidatus Peribacter riflensis]HBU10170.1 thioredoxin family protein [Candidatus Peribacter riflensis]